MRVTKRHFAVFKAECERLQKLWNLTGWELRVLHRQLDGDGVLACNDADLAHRVLYVRLTLVLRNSWAKSLPDAEIRDAARHEMVHALTQPLLEAAQSRYTTEDELAAASHEVLRNLDALLPR